MTEKQKANDFEWVPGYAECVGHAANSWAHVEYYINSSIWRLAGVSPAPGACMTAQIVSLFGRLSALLALLKLRRADQKLIDMVNKFAESSRGPNELRNRIVHDIWLIDNMNAAHMGQLKITAAKKLEFSVQTVPLAELKADLGKIAVCREQASAIAAAIEAAMPTLPKISLQELAPVVETH